MLNSQVPPEEFQTVQAFIHPFIPGYLSYLYHPNFFLQKSHSPLYLTVPITSSKGPKPVCLTSTTTSLAQVSPISLRIILRMRGEADHFLLGKQHLRPGIRWPQMHLHYNYKNKNYSHFTNTTGRGSALNLWSGDADKKIVVTLQSSRTYREYPAESMSKIKDQTDL